MGHGWEGVLLKLLRGKDYRFEVTGAEQLTEHYRRLSLTDGGMLADLGVHPTMWVRLWFDGVGRPHQRAYTLVDPDADVGTFRLEFSLHDGRACDPARVEVRRVPRRDSGAHLVATVKSELPGGDGRVEDHR